MIFAEDLTPEQREKLLQDIINKIKEGNSCPIRKQFRW